MVGVPAKEMEEWVVALREKTGLDSSELDWHYSAGRAILRVMGDEPDFLKKLNEAIQELAPKLSEVVRADNRKYGVTDERVSGMIFALGFEGVSDLKHP